jgi:O-antigen/teichoic acid export membrane protein
MGAAMVLVLALLGPWAFGYWTAGRVEYDGVLLYALLGTMLLRAVWYTSNVVPSAINRHQRIAMVYVLSALVTTAGFAVLLGVWSFHGALFALVALEAAMIAAVLPTSLRLSQDSALGFVGFLVRPPNPAALARTVFKRKVSASF